MCERGSARVRGVFMEEQQTESVAAPGGRNQRVEGMGPDDPDAAHRGKYY
ncbi:MAG: hypothetical protein WCP70_03920 [Methanothrix sp.]